MEKKNIQEGGSVLITLLAGVVIVGILGGMVYMMPTESEVSPQKQKYIDEQNRYVGNTIGMGVAAAMDRSKTDDFNISDRKCRDVEYAKINNDDEDGQRDFKNICITEIDAMSKKIDEILDGLKGVGYDGYVEDLKEKKERYTTELIKELTEKGISEEFLKKKDFNRLMDWYKVINHKNNLKDDGALNELLNETDLENIISYEELFENDGINDFMKNKPGDIMEFKSNRYSNAFTGDTWDKRDKENLKEKDFVMVHVEGIGYIINFSLKIDTNLSDFGNNIAIEKVNENFRKALNNIFTNKDAKLTYYVLQDNDPEDIKLRHLGKMLVYMIKNKGFFSGVSSKLFGKKSDSDTKSKEGDKQSKQINDQLSEIEKKIAEYEEKQTLNFEEKKERDRLVSEYEELIEEQKKQGKEEEQERQEQEEVSGSQEKGEKTQEKKKSQYEKDKVSEYMTADIKEDKLNEFAKKQAEAILQKLRKVKFPPIQR